METSNFTPTNNSLGLSRKPKTAMKRPGGPYRSNDIAELSALSSSGKLAEIERAIRTVRRAQRLLYSELPTALKILRNMSS